ncbi:TetR family transcriptional regulator C-terminal domain-containing protein [Streptomyces albogriseolus]|uniref:TetR family transcriptional regulator C-terminal domain-containing protein n=1 Tax=Streptomyces albogriseolus TaxID=1887 RepID=UPI0033AC6CCC
MRGRLPLGEPRSSGRCSTAAPPPDSPRELVRDVLLQILPLDDTRRLEGRVGLAFLAYAVVKPAIREGLREEAAGMRGFVAQQLRTAGADGVDPHFAATGLMAHSRRIRPPSHPLSPPRPPAVAARWWPHC